MALNRVLIHVASELYPRETDLESPFNQQSLVEHLSSTDGFGDLGQIEIVEEGKRNKIFGETIDLDSVFFHCYVIFVLVQSIAILREGS